MWDSVNCAIILIPVPARRKLILSNMSSQDNKICPTPVKEVPGMIRVQDQILAGNILKKASKMTNWVREGFPGTVLAPMRTSTLKFLIDEDYAVSAKADGTRYMMWIDGPGSVYLINRNAEIFSTVQQMNFPFSEGDKGHLYDTLLDGELIRCNDLATSSKPMSYLIFDVISICGVSVAGEALPHRLNIAKKIIGTRKRAYEELEIPISKEPFHIGQIQFHCVTSSSASKLLNGTHSYESDGLIFTPIHRPYNDWPTRSGVCDYSLKWKPANLNTIDFLLRIDDVNGNSNPGIGNLYVSIWEENTEALFGFGTIELTPDLVRLNNTIIECKNVNGKWILLRERSDRKMPNPLQTAKDTLKSIANGISKDQLLQFISDGILSKTHACLLCSK